MGLAAALLVSWATAARARVALSRRARSQVGLAEIPDHTVTALIAVSSGSAAGRRAVPLFGSRRRRRRARDLDDALGPMLQSVVDQLRVGRSLLSALESVGPTTAEPLASIVRRIVNETRLGGSVADSLRTVADEERNRHLEVIASAVALHAEQGGSLTDILVGVAESIEDEDRLRRDMLTLTADARLSANVLLIMPVGALVITSLLSPGYATPLVATPVGRILSLVGLTLGALGVLWLRALARPEEL
jgi:tight adherence protein B